MLFQEESDLKLHCLKKKRKICFIFFAILEFLNPSHFVVKFLGKPCISVPRPEYSDTEQLSFQKLCICLKMYFLQLVGNLSSEVTPKQVYKALKLDTYPSQSIIELDLAVDKRGKSKGYAFLQIPRSCSSKLRKQDRL